jgi:hypothetical protein
MREHDIQDRAGGRQRQGVRGTADRQHQKRDLQHRQQPVQGAQHLDAAGHAVQIIAAGKQFAGVVARIEKKLRQPLKVPVRLIGIGKLGKQLRLRECLVLENPLAILQVAPHVGMSKLRGDAEKKVHANENRDGDDLACPQIERRERRVGIGEIDSGADLRWLRFARRRRRRLNCAAVRIACTCDARVVTTSKVVLAALLRVGNHRVRLVEELHPLAGIGVTRINIRVQLLR